jgi:hypothetical protein
MPRSNVANLFFILKNDEKTFKSPKSHENSGFVLTFSKKNFKF